MSEHNSTTLILSHALLFFGNDSSTAIYRASATLERGEVVLGNPVQVTDAVLDDLQKLRSGDDLVVIPDRVIALSNSSVAWFVPAAPRVLNFSNRADAALMTLSGQTFPQPPLVMISTPTALKIYALACDSKPELDTELMLAPHYNVFNTNGVCYGSMTRPERNDVGSITAWEESFFDSRFTHNTGGLRWTSAYTHSELWQAAAKRGEFDPAWLQPANVTLRGAINGARGKGR